MNTEIYKLLIHDIQIKTGKEIRYGKDCKKLAEQIEKETGRQISHSTLKRFFGFVKTPFNASKYTLDTFVIFLGFENWHEYLNSFDFAKHKANHSDSWNHLKKRMMLITNHSLLSLKKRTSYEPEKFISRAFIYKKLEAFLESQKAAAMFVAPDGYGKSTLAIQIVEHYFKKEDSKYKNDIVFLIDGGIFFNLYTQNSNIDLLSQLLEFKINSSLRYFFEQNPENRKGSILMIIDSVDEIFFDKERYHRFVENLMRLIMGHNSEWYKTLLTCRPENLEAFSYQIKKNPYLEKFWYDINLENNDVNDIINIPLFSNEELNELFEKHQLEFNCGLLQQKSKNVLKIIRYPYFFNLFARQYKKINEISEITLLQNFINEKIYMPPYNDEKVTLVNTMIDLINSGEIMSSIEKDSLFKKAKISDLVYNDMLSNGLIYEYTITNHLLRNTTFVKFKHSLIFEYLLLEKWLRDRPMDAELFFILKEFYSNNIQLQCTLLILYIKILKHENKTVVLEQLHNRLKDSMTFTSGEKNSCFSQIFSLLVKTWEKAPDE